jgi:hypothetical protein
LLRRGLGVGSFKVVRRVDAVRFGKEVLKRRMGEIFM